VILELCDWKAATLPSTKTININPLICLVWWIWKTSLGSYKDITDNTNLPQSFLIVVKDRQHQMTKNAKCLDFLQEKISGYRLHKLQDIELSSQISSSIFSMIVFLKAKLCE
jgi:hypothetical protein